MWVGQQFQKRAPVGIASDGQPTSLPFWLHVNQVLGLGASAKNRVGCMTQPQPRDALLIVGIGLLGRAFELRGGWWEANPVAAAHTARRVAGLT
jgi:hypothetical protein